MASGISWIRLVFIVIAQNSTTVLLGWELSENLGHTVIVDNPGGAIGNIGTKLAAHVTPDGYAALVGNVAPNAINVSLFKQISLGPG